MLPSYVIRAMQIKTNRHCHLSSTVAEIQHADINIYIEQWERSLIAGGNTKWYSNLKNSFGHFLTLDVILLYWSSSHGLALGIYLSQLKTSVQTEPQTWMCIAALLIFTKLEVTRMPFNEWMDKHSTHWILFHYTGYRLSGSPKDLQEP